MIPTRPSLVLPVLVTVIASSLVAACSPSASRGGNADEPVDVDKGRALFQQSCRSCHTLADANAHGTFGPDLDDVQADLPRIREQIDDGGGGMPPDLLRGDDADVVARYVAQVAGAPDRVAPPDDE